MIVSQPAQRAFTRLIASPVLSGIVFFPKPCTRSHRPAAGKGHPTGLPAPGKACLAPGQSSPLTPLPRRQPTRQEASSGLQSVPRPMGCLRGKGPGTVVDAAIHGSWSGRAQVSVCVLVGGWKGSWVLGVPASSPGGHPPVPSQGRAVSLTPGPGWGPRDPRREMLSSRGQSEGGEAGRRLRVSPVRTGRRPECACGRRCCPADVTLPAP